MQTSIWTLIVGNFIGVAVPVMVTSGVMWAMVKRNAKDIQRLFNTKQDKDLCDERHPAHPDSAPKKPPDY